MSDDKLDAYDELLLRVFGNPNGDELLAEWQQMYGDRPSHSKDNTPEHTAFLEGERNFYTTIKARLNHATRR